MDSVAAIALELQRRGISLSLSGEAPSAEMLSQTLPPQIAEFLASRHSDLIAYLHARDAAPVGRPERTSLPLIPSLTQEMWWKWIDPAQTLALSIIELFEGVDAARVEQAIQVVLMRHEILCSRYTEGSGKLTAEVIHWKDVPIHRETLAMRAGRTEKAALEERIRRFLSTPLPASSSQPVKAGLVSVSASRCVAMLLINHLIVDGTSIEIIRTELRQEVANPGCLGSGAGKFRYADFARWQRASFAKGGDLTAAYWRNWLAAKPPLHSPQTRTELLWRPGRKARRKYLIPAAVHDRIVQLAKNSGTFVFVAHLTILAMAVTRWSGRERVALRSIYDGRTQTEFRGLVGLVTGADAVSVTIRSIGSFIENMRAVEAEYLAAIKLRLPNIYAFPPHVVPDDLGRPDQKDNIPVVLNYRNLAAANLQGNRAAASEHSWPPQEQELREEVWRHPVSPICLELTNRGSDLMASFLLHCDLLSSGEQNDFISQFFNALGAEASREYPPGRRDRPENMRLPE